MIAKKENKLTSVEGSKKNKHRKLYNGVIVKMDAAMKYDMSLIWGPGKLAVSKVVETDIDALVDGDLTETSNEALKLRGSDLSSFFVALFAFGFVMFG